MEGKESIQYLSDDERGYLVDFEQKNISFEEQQEKKKEEERKKKIEELKKLHLKEEEEEEQRSQRRKMAMSLEEQTKKGRIKHLEMKVKRKYELEQRLKQIKEKQMKKISSNEENNNLIKESEPYNIETPTDLEDEFLVLEKIKKISKKNNSMTDYSIQEHDIDELFKNILENQKI